MWLWPHNGDIHQLDRPEKSKCSAGYFKQDRIGSDLLPEYSIVQVDIDGKRSLRGSENGFNPS